MSYKVLQRPLGERVLRKAAKDKLRVKGVVLVELRDVMLTDDEGFVDLISTLLTGCEALMDVEWRILKGIDTTLHLEVSGDPSLCVDSEAA